MRARIVSTAPSPSAGRAPGGPSAAAAWSGRRGSSRTDPCSTLGEVALLAALGDHVADERLLAARARQAAERIHARRVDNLAWRCAAALLAVWPERPYPPSIPVGGDRGLEQQAGPLRHTHGARAGRRRSGRDDHAVDRVAARRPVGGGPHGQRGRAREPRSCRGPTTTCSPGSSCRTALEAANDALDSDLEVSRGDGRNEDVEPFAEEELQDQARALVLRPSVSAGLRAAVARAYAELDAAGLGSGATGNVSAVDRRGGRRRDHPARREARPVLGRGRAGGARRHAGSKGPEPSSELRHPPGPACAAAPARWPTPTSRTPWHCSLIADELPTVVAVQAAYCGGAVPVIPYVPTGTQEMADAVAAVRRAACRR